MAIQNLFKHKNLRERLARWFVTLQNHDVTFEYIPGKKNTAADALSGSSENEVNSAVCSVQELITLDSDMIAVEQSKNETLHDLIQYLKNPTRTGQPPKCDVTGNACPMAVHKKSTPRGLLLSLTNEDNPFNELTHVQYLSAVFLLAVISDFSLGFVLR